MKRIILAIVAGLSMVNSVQAINRAARRSFVPVPAQSVAPKQTVAEEDAKQLVLKKAEEAKQLVEAAKKAAQVKLAAAKKEAEQKAAAFRKKLAIALGVTFVAATAGVVGPEVYNAYDSKGEEGKKFDSNKMFDEKTGFWRPQIAEQYAKWFPTKETVA